MLYQTKVIVDKTTFLNYSVVDNKLDDVLWGISTVFLEYFMEYLKA